jgi:hypothetical protein
MPSRIEEYTEETATTRLVADNESIRTLIASDDLPSHQNYLIRNVATGLVLDKAISAANTSILRPLNGKLSQLWNLGGGRGGATILTREAQIMLVAKWDDANKVYSNKVVVADGSGGLDPAAGKWMISHDGCVQHDATGLMLAAESSNPDMNVPYQAILQTRSPSLEQQWQFIPLFEDVLKYCY